MKQVEFKGGPMDGDKLPVGYIPRPVLHVVSNQHDADDSELMHVYTDDAGMYRYEGLALLAPGPIAPLRIGERLS
jgi:hypothetical protein